MVINLKQKLSNLKKGQIGHIVEININDEESKRHLLEMGLTKGTKVKIKKIAPIGKTISIEIRGYELCLSENEANGIVII